MVQYVALGNGFNHDVVDFKAAKVGLIDAFEVESDGVDVDAVVEGYAYGAPGSRDEAGPRNC